jgi:hypothetical protein
MDMVPVQVRISAGRKVGPLQDRICMKSEKSTNHGQLDSLIKPLRTANNFPLPTCITFRFKNNSTKVARPRDKWHSKIGQDKEVTPSESYVRRNEI